MFSLVGILIVIGAVLGGYLMHHGKLEILVQPNEYLIIWGAALGSMLISTPLPVLIRLMKSFGKILSAGRFSKKFYLDTLKMFNELFQTARKNGMMKLEQDVEKPEQSDIFKRYPAFLKDHHSVHFVCDTLRVAITGGIPPHDLDQLIDSDLEVHHHHNAQPVHALSRVSDALPGLGIVAAVLGIVITMESLGGPPEELGKKVAAALVGTFLGVLTCYGFVGPLAAAIEAADEAEGAYYRFMKTGLVAFVKGHPPIMALEFARRTIPHGNRPSFSEMEKECKKTAQAATASPQS
jgi:chemotaxis protein MotA